MKKRMIALAIIVVVLTLESCGKQFSGEIVSNRGRVSSRHDCSGGRR